MMKCENTEEHEYVNKLISNQQQQQQPVTIHLHEVHLIRFFTLISPSVSLSYTFFEVRQGDLCSLPADSQIEQIYIIDSAKVKNIVNVCVKLQT